MEQAEPKTIQLEVVKEQSAMVTVTGGVELEVEHLDGSKEKIKVRQIPVTKLEEFMTHLSDESVALRIYCDKPVEWVDTLTHDSVSAVTEKGLELNQSFLAAWCRRRAKWLEMTNVGVVAELQQKLDALSQVLQSVASAQKSPTTMDLPLKK